MKIHDEVLAAARRLGVARGDWRFTPAEIVRALPHLNERSVRTHVVSRCCVNAPNHHAHRWPYFKRLGRGQYIIEKAFRHSPNLGLQPSQTAFQVAEEEATHKIAGAIVRSTVHAVIFEQGGRYTAECLQVAVVTQGNSLDETVRNLQEGIDLYMSDEETGTLGLSPHPRLALSIETSARPS